MATKTSRPGRTLVVFLLLIVAMFAGVAAIGTWKPRLGLDLQGGTRITLQAKSSGGGSITPDKLDEAVGIISSRVNGAGVAEAEVTTQGDDIIVIEIPGEVDNDLAKTIGSTAQLRFRLVAANFPPKGTQTQATPTPTGGTPTTPAPTDSTSGTPTTPTGETTGPKLSPGETGKTTKNGKNGKNRVAPPWDEDNAGGAPTTSPPSSTSTSSEPTPTPTTPTQPTSTPSSADGPPTALIPPDLVQIDDPYVWVRNPPQEWQVRAASYQCPEPGKKTQSQPDIPSQPLVACDEDGQRYLLGPAMLEGTEVTDASAGIPQQGVNYVVNMEFNGEGAKTFRDVTTKIAINLGGQYAGLPFAIVLDGKVLSAPTNAEPIPGGRAEISGSTDNPFTQESATSLANSLKYGALPLSFLQQGVSDEGPELASNQLAAGVVAGIVGLILVVIYCLLYYRGLGLVVIASLLIAGAITYACVLLLGHAYGFTLTLPGIAGLIVAVGITADSFIIYFERLRDEVRDGRTLRTSVETGWVRARTTILAADAVSLLAAIVLFIFAIGVVKGFAFALGLTTLIDVFVVFFFTKPMVTMLSRTKFFGQGHKWSGLDRQHLGMPPLPRRVRTARGET
ncbi:MAG: protein translocase subunit SecD [Propionibacteriales bacterium]|nr:protein translocase subunit SecD [Propionibacteriales bacterium]